MLTIFTSFIYGLFIQATVIRESTLDDHYRDEDILVKLAFAGDRSRVSASLPGIGLGFCGVGFNNSAMYNFKYKPTNPEKVNKLKLAIEENKNNLIRDSFCLF